MRAEFRCWRCSHEWQDRPGPTDSITREPRTCRACGHIYMTWLNYERDFAPRKGGHQ